MLRSTHGKEAGQSGTRTLEYVNQTKDVKGLWNAEQDGAIIHLYISISADDDGNISIWVFFFKHKQECSKP